MYYDNDENFSYKVIPEAEGYKNGHPFKGMVICIATNSVGSEMERYLDRLTDRLPAKMQRVVHIHPYTPQDMFEEFQGVAYTSVEDTFDVEKGKKLARQRAVRQLNRAKSRRYKVIENCLVGYAMNLLREINRLDSFEAEFPSVN